MITITESVHRENIKPLFDRIYGLKNLKNLDKNPIIGDFLVDLTFDEYNYPNLKKSLESMTENQKKFFRNQGMEKELNKAQEFLNKIILD